MIDDGKNARLMDFGLTHPIDGDEDDNPGVHSLDFRSIGVRLSC